jgi:release factor glutamine methyltransferase
LLENVDGKFDLIVANLPYISRHDRDQLAPEVLRDPEVALFAGEKGDEIIRRLIETAPLHLNAGGLLALEIGLGQERRPWLEPFAPEKLPRHRGEKRLFR